MTGSKFLIRSLRYYWRTNLAVVAGVAVAVAVLAGALVVGDSVRASLRRLALERIGRTTSVIQGGGLFREALTDAFGDSAPMITLEGLVTHQTSGRRATGVAVYGVDNRFWKFHGRAPVELANREAALSRPLADELGVKADDTVLVRVEQQSDIPAESLFGRKGDAAPAIRLRVKQVIEAADLGEFTLRPTQSAVKAMFVPLTRLQLEVNADGRVNTVLIGTTAAPASEILDHAWTIEDIGLRVKTLEDRDSLQLESAAGILPDAIVQSATATAAELGLKVTPVLTYMATTIRDRDRETAYALVAAADLSALGVEAAQESSVVLNDWAARDLGARVGDAVTLEYYYWHGDGRLTTEKTEVTVAAVAPIEGLAADRDLTPEYPGITDADDVADWDPPFPVDLGRIQKRDEDYWDRYRATPKAWISLERGQKLWQSRWGKVTALRLALESSEDEALARAATEFTQKLRARLSPADQGLVLAPVREQNMAASQGATDFGEYFTYFSFFLMTSALLLAGLFFSLSLQQRSREVGLLQAVGFAPQRVRRQFFKEGLVLAVVGALIGAGGAVAYAAVVLHGLGTWWSGAVGTQQLVLHITPPPMVSGVAGGIAAAMLAIYLTLRGLRAISARSLLAGESGAGALSGRGPAASSQAASRVAAISAVLAVVLLGASAAKQLPAAAGFFGGGMLLLVAALAWLRKRLGTTLSLTDTTAKLAFRNLAWRPNRTVLSAALIASATFLIVSVEAFRRDPHAAAGEHGYSLIAESVRPIYRNLNTDRTELNIPNIEGLRFEALRLRPGDDASCLNLYRPKNPRILGVPETLIRQQGQPWELLQAEPVDGATPAIADANSMQYVLHAAIGDVITLPGGEKLRLVGSLSDSIFQGEIVVAESNFVRLFPEQQGYRVFLIDAPAASLAPATSELETALADYGFDVTTTADRLASFHRVENTYLSTFQTLGALGLLLGTLGLAAVLFRNVLERRKEFGLLAAVGFSRAQLSSLVLRENVLLLVISLMIGTLTAALAIAPVLAVRGAQFSWLSMAMLLGGVLITGVFAAAAATRIAMRLPLIESIRSGL